MNLARAPRRERAAHSPKPQQAERRRFFWLALSSLVLSFIVTLALTAPLTLLRVPAQALPAGVSLVPIAGTFWHGQWQLGAPQIAPLQVTTQLQLSSLFMLKPTWQVKIQGAGVEASALVATTPQQIRLTALQAQLSAASPLLKLLTAWPLGGTVQLQGNAQLNRVPTGWALTAAAGTALWQNAQITTTAPLALGDIQAVARLDQAQLTLTLTPQASATAPLSGELVVTSGWPIITAPAIAGSLKPSAQASAALAEQLKLLGRPDATGAIAISGVLPGRY
ncbi:MAG: type II secretion system protein N [Halothiobacillus sp.]